MLRSYLPKKSRSLQSSKLSLLQWCIKAHLATGSNLLSQSYALPSLPGKESWKSRCTVRHLMTPRHNGISTSSNAHRLPAGELLWWIDLIAARAALKHAYGSFTLDKDRGRTAATVGMNRIYFWSPICIGDQVDMVADVVSTGSSSIAVRVRLSRIQFPTGEKMRVAEADVYMVTVGSDLKAVAAVPPVLLVDVPEKDRGAITPTHPLTADYVAKLREHQDCLSAIKNANRRERQTEKEVEALSVDDLQGIMYSSLRISQSGNLTDTELKFNLFEPINEAKQAKVRIHQTLHVANRLFFPDALNLNDTVYGGEILRWMEENATHCGRVFGGNKNCFSVGMHRVKFKQPVYKTDWMELRAYVVFVRDSTMEIDVEVRAERVRPRSNENDNENVTEWIVTNTASFVVVNLDEVGKPMKLSKGLEVMTKDASQPDGGVEWQKRFLLAKYRYYESRKLRYKNKYD